MFLVDEAVQTAYDAVFGNMGQCCCAGTRTFVQEGIYDEFVRKAALRAQKRVMGDPFDPSTDHGPQVWRAVYSYLWKSQYENFETQ